MKMPTSYPVGFAIPDHDPGIRETEFQTAVPIWIVVRGPGPPVRDEPVVLPHRLRQGLEPSNKREARPAATPSTCATASRRR
jgi:hypothetical protein